MQVTISVGGRFHTFYLIQQLYKKWCLRKLITYLLILNLWMLHKIKMGAPGKNLNELANAFPFGQTGLLRVEVQSFCE